MFLTLNKFLEHFPTVKISRAQFIKKLIITYSPPITLDEALSLKPVRMEHRGKIIDRQLIKSSKDYRYEHREELIDYLYQIIVTHRHYYLKKHFYAYFYFPNPYTLKWNSDVDIWLPDDFAGSRKNESNWGGNLSLQKNDASRRIVRNLFYLELLHLTKATNSVKSQVSYWNALDNMYNRLMLEDRLFCPSSIKLFLRPKGTKREEKDLPKPPKSFTGFNPRLNWHNVFYQLQAYQGKASIINPYFVHWALENLFSGGSSSGSSRGRGGGRKMLTPVLSWGSYLIGFMHSAGWDHYVGIDVMPSVCQKVKFLADYYHGLEEMKRLDEKKEVDIYCQPSEVLAKDKKFLHKYKNYFDLVLICPPYFNMESYHEGQQSTDLYPDYDDWLNKYWLATVKMCYTTCKKGGYFAMIINDYNTLSGESYPLIKDLTNKVLETEFKYHKYYNLFNRTSPLRVNKKERTERLVVFKK